MKNQFDEAKRVSLSTDEKDAMRAQVVTFVKTHPVEAPRKFTFFSSLRAIHLSPALAVLTVLLVGAGTSFAAEGSLPGDRLYPVKIHVNENVRAAITVSDHARGEWEGKRATRRLKEAERLDAKGRLDAPARADMKARVDVQAKAFEARAERIREKQGSQSAFELHANFESSLKAHEAILKKLSEPTREKDGGAEEPPRDPPGKRRAKEINLNLDLDLH